MITEMEYEELLTLPRYQEGTAWLQGNSVTFVDAASYYYSYRELYIQELYDFEAETPNPVIIDGGANIGLASIRWKKRYPDALIRAFEPDGLLAAVARENFASQELGGIEVIEAAIAGTEGKRQFHREGADAGGFRQPEHCLGSAQVDCLALPDLIVEPHELVKLDIEGAETEALLACPSLRSIRFLLFEYHAWPGEPVRLHELLARLQDEHFRYWIQTQYPVHQPLQSMVTSDASFQLNVFAKRQ